MKKELTVKIVKGLFTFGVVAGLVAVGGESMAQTSGLGDSVSAVKTGLTDIPTVISAACYIAGAALIGVGLMKLKAHSENPGQTPIGHGLGRLVIGGALLAAPAMGSWVQGSIGVSSGSGASYTGFGTVN